METILALLALSLTLVLVMAILGLFYAARLIDRLTDKIMSRDYADYRAGQAIKAAGDEGESMPRSDAAEAAIEAENNEGLVQRLRILDDGFDAAMTTGGRL